MTWIAVTTPKLQHMSQSLNLSSCTMVSKHLPHVERCLYCPQAFLSLDFHCRMETSDISRSKRACTLTTAKTCHERGQLHKRGEDWGKQQPGTLQKMPTAAGRCQQQLGNWEGDTHSPSDPQQSWATPRHWNNAAAMAMQRRRPPLHIWGRGTAHSRQYMLPQMCARRTVYTQSTYKQKNPNGKGPEAYVLQPVLWAWWLWRAVGWSALSGKNADMCICASKTGVNKKTWATK